VSQSKNKNRFGLQLNYNIREIIASMKELPAQITKMPLWFMKNIKHRFFLVFYIRLWYYWNR